MEASNSKAGSPYGGAGAEGYGLTEGAMTTPCIGVLNQRSWACRGNLDQPFVTGAAGRELGPSWRLTNQLQETCRGASAHRRHCFTRGSCPAWSVSMRHGRSGGAGRRTPASRLSGYLGSRLVRSRVLPGSACLTRGAFGLRGGNTRSADHTLPALRTPAG